MSKKYEVTIDGTTEEVSTKKEVTELVVGAALDGGEHEVAVEVVDPKADAAADEPTGENSNEDNPAGAVSGGVDAMGITHIR